jgi:L-alanine-DL-glutamate epimerase-like enolase superfamily enzyme
MKIQNARSIVTCPGRNFVTVRLETDEGVYGIGDAIGHGVDINEKLAAKYPYKRAYLPVNRLVDGSMCNW